MPAQSDTHVFERACALAYMRASPHNQALPLSKAPMRVSPQSMSEAWARELEDPYRGDRGAALTLVRLE